MDKKTAFALLDFPLSELMVMADQVRRECSIDTVELCTILNAKSGLCAEDCKFCAQSCRHDTGISIYPLVTVDEMLNAAVAASNRGASRFGIVTSGNTLTDSDLELIAQAITLIRERAGIKVCASLGKLSEEQLLLLKRAGLERYHHNIETSSRYFPRITTTHSFADRLMTIQAAMRVGLEVCSGGIIGLGETWEDRIEMVLTLKELGVTSVPINVLVPIKGTSLKVPEPITAMDAIKTIALFRIILRNVIIKVAAGRESVLKDFQAMAFMAGANGMLIGGYLTVRGRSIDEDQVLVTEVEKAWKE